MTDTDVTQPMTPPKTTLEQIQRWAPSGHTVEVVEVEVPGLDVFMVAPPDASPDQLPADGVRPYTIVAVAGGPRRPILERDAVMRAAAAATRDARALARLAMLVHRTPGELLEAATTDEQRRAQVAAPAVVGDAVEFWVSTTGADRMLMRGRLELSTGALLELAPPPPG